LPELSAGGSEDETAAALSREFIIMNTKMTKLGAAFARRWLLLVEPGFCTGHYDRNHDKRRIHEYVPGSETMSSQAKLAPARCVIP